MSSFFTMSKSNGTVNFDMSVDRVDLSIAEMLKSDMIRALSDTETDVVVNMKAVDFMDSSGLGAFVGVKKRLGKGHTLHFKNASPFVEKILKLTKLGQVFGV